MKRIFFVSFILFLSVSSSFSQNWYVCTGSFRQKTNAEKWCRQLKDNGFDARISAYIKNDGSVMYRVLLIKDYSQGNAAKTDIANLDKNEKIKALQAKDLWPCQPEEQYISITDSDTGLPVALADVTIDNTYKKVTSNEGQISLPNALKDGEHSLQVMRGDEYVPTNSTFTVKQGAVITASQFSIPKKADFERIKAVLDWGATPYDLDSHVICGTHHVYFANMKSGGITLDRDDTDSYGPETVTIANADKQAVYSYFIHNYSDGGNEESDRMSNSKAQVKVFINNEFYKTYNIPTNTKGLIWHVFDVVNGDHIIDKNTVSNELQTGEIRKSE